MRLEQSTSYSRTNFAYGSTPLSSWLALFRSTPVRAKLESKSCRYVVLGSSIGWLVFYGACICGLESEGVELMPLLVQVALTTDY